MTIRILRVKNTPTLARIIWLAGTLFLGSITILAHLLSHPHNRLQADEQWRRALSASVIAITAYTIAWILALTLLMSFGSEPNPLAILGSTYLLPLLVSLLLFRVPLQATNGSAPFKDILKQNFLSEVITFNLAFAAMFSTTWLLSSRLLTTIPQPTSPFFWVMLSVIAFAGLVVLFPLHYWLVSRGYSIPSDVHMEDTRSLSLPTLRTAWPTLLATLGIMVAAMAVTISQVA